MAQADVIREFLVQLGFKTDERSLKKFSDGVEGATRQVAGLVTAIAGSATVAALYKFASNMEAVYFSVQKAGAGAVNLKAFEKAAQNFGASAGDALQSVQSLARWMRETPGSTGFLESLGVKTTDANGKIKDTTQLMLELGQVLRDKPYPVARQYGAMLGISEDTLRAMMNGDFARELEKQRALLQDSGYDQASKDAHKFMVELREVETKLEAIGVKIGMFALEVANTLGPVVLPVLDKIAEGWKKIFDWTAAAGRGVQDYLTEEQKNRGGENVAKLLAFFGNKEANDALAANGVPGYTRSDAGAPPAAASTSRSGALDPMKFFMGLGWSKEQAAGMVANLRAESGMNPGAVGDNGQAYGVAQWHPDRQANFAKWAGKDIRQSTLEEQLRFVNYELTEGAERKAGMLLRASQSAEFAGQVMSRHYERPRNAAEEAARRGASAVQIAQETKIYVTGGDAAATGRAVAGEQDRVNQNLARNLQTAVN